MVWFSSLIFLEVVFEFPVLYINKMLVVLSRVFILFGFKSIGFNKGS